MNILFLDIDGVLCTHRACDSYDGLGFMGHEKARKLLEAA